MRFRNPFRSALPNGYRFVVERDYLSSIPLTEIVLNPNLTQNPGYTGRPLGENL